MQHRLLREMTIASVAAMLLGGLDLAGVLAFVPRPFGSAATALHFWLCSAGALTTLFVVLQAFWLVLSIAFSKLPSRYFAPQWGWIGVAPLAALLLNCSYAGSKPAFFAGLLVLSALYGAALSRSLSRVWEGTHRWTVAGVWLGVAAALFAVDAASLRGLYADQHLTVGLFTWAAAQAGLRIALAGEARSVAGLAVPVPALLAVIVLWATPGDAVSQNLKYVSYTASTSTRQALRLIAPVTDADRDGFSSLLGGGDCAPLDGGIHPGALEVPGDGIDQNCLGGDPAAITPEPWDTGPAPRTRGLPDVRNVVLITVDALRYDRVAGPKAETALEGLWARGTSFAYAYCPFPGTVLSFYSTLGSVSPSRARLKEVGNFRVPVSDLGPALMEVLTSQGVDARAVVYHRILGPAYGIARGAAQVWTAGSSGAEITSPATTKAALEYLDAMGEGPFFLWVHYYDPHEPYVRDDGSSDGSMEERYDMEVARAGAEAVSLVKGLETRGLDHSTAVIVTSDHGEEFGDHGAYFHGQSVYDESARVPLLVILPGRVPGHETAPVSLLDLAPTVLDLLGFRDQRPRHWEGRSLGPFLAGLDSEPGRPVFVQAFQKGGEQRVYGMVDWPWKLIYRQEGHAFELYHLEQDPGETINVFDAAPGVAARMTADLDRHLAYMGGPQ